MILEGIVIAAIVLAAAYVGYHAWQEFQHHPAESHSIELVTQYDKLMTLQMLETNQNKEFTINYS